jgi:Glycosyl transferase family 8
VDAQSRSGRTAICFVLATPRAETRVEAIARGVRLALQRIPLLGRAVPLQWSPGRRQGFAAGLRACVHSLRRRHALLPPILVLRPVGQEVTLADVDLVVPFDPRPYDAIPRTSHYFGREVFYKLELFRLSGYDRIVYLDCDTLMLDDISGLWDPAQYADRPLYAAREETAMGFNPASAGRLNTGVMVINRPLLSGAVYRRLFELARRGVSYDRGDQGVINAFLEEEGPGAAGTLDPTFNVPIWARKTGWWDACGNRARVLHFTCGLKPWMAEHHYDWQFDREFKRLWDEAYRLVPPTAGVAASGQAPSRSLAPSGTADIPWSPDPHTDGGGHVTRECCAVQPGHHPESGNQ